MVQVEKTVDVEVPVRTAYNQWTQFEEFPRFMEGVKEVHQIDDKRLHWVAEVGGKQKEWDATIVEQRPDQCVAWTTKDGDRNAGVVTFEQLADDKTRVHVKMGYEPDGVVEAAGSALGFATRRIDGDLKRFKEFIEERGTETGGWRGAIDRNEGQAAARQDMQSDPRAVDATSGREMGTDEDHRTVS
jgi:uncharacterized membrane protein